MPTWLAPEAAPVKEKQQAGLEPWQIQSLQDDKRKGLTVEGLAARYGVSIRTVYRYLDVRVERIYIDGWTAWFALGAKKAPQRLTVWEQA
jgi:transposase